MQNMEFHMSWNLCENGNHENQIEDEREGNVVCTDCGLILGPIYQYSIVNNDKKYVPIKIIKTNILSQVYWKIKKY